MQRVAEGPLGKDLADEVVVPHTRPRRGFWMAPGRLSFWRRPTFWMVLREAARMGFPLDTPIWHWLCFSFFRGHQKETSRFEGSWRVGVRGNFLPPPGSLDFGARWLEGHWLAPRTGSKEWPLAHADRSTRCASELTGPILGKDAHSWILFFWPILEGIQGRLNSNVQRLLRGEPEGHLPLQQRA